MTAITLKEISLNGLIFPYTDTLAVTSSYFNYFLVSIKEKFKSLKNCQISFKEGFEQYCENTYCDYASQLAKDLDCYYIDLDEIFDYRSIEFKVLIQANERLDLQRN